jgi:hypothetical protein
LQLRKPVAASEGAEAGEPRPRPRPSGEDKTAASAEHGAHPLSVHAASVLRSKCAQLERQVVAAAADARRSEARSADAVAAVEGVRAHARAVACAHGSEQAVAALTAWADATLARFDAKHAGGPLEASWEVPFVPAAGNRFLWDGSGEGSSWGTQELSVVGAVNGEARALLDGARVAALEERLVSLAPQLEALLTLLERRREGGSEEAEALRRTLPLLSNAAHELVDMAALAPARGRLFGSHATRAQRLHRRAGAPPSQPGPPGARAAPPEESNTV